MTQILAIPEIMQQYMIETNVWTHKCPLAFERLRLIKTKHYDFSGHIKTGQIIIFDLLAESVAEIFKQLFKRQFPINSLQTIENFAGNDQESMAANNSLGFNFRKIAGSDKITAWLIHGIRYLSYTNYGFQPK